MQTRIPIENTQSDSRGGAGAWIGSLTMFEPYRPAFIVVALVLIALGFPFAAPWFY